MGRPVGRLSSALVGLGQCEAAGSRVIPRRDRRDPQSAQRRIWCAFARAACGLRRMVAPSRAAARIQGVSLRTLRTFAISREKTGRDHPRPNGLGAFSSPQ
jgi:hypothetical protein